MTYESGPLQGSLADLTAFHRFSQLEFCISIVSKVRTCHVLGPIVRFCSIANFFTANVDTTCSLQAKEKKQADKAFERDLEATLEADEEEEFNDQQQQQQIPLNNYQQTETDIVVSSPDKKQQKQKPTRRSKRGQPTAAEQQIDHAEEQEDEAAAVGRGKRRKTVAKLSKEEQQQIANAKRRGGGEGSRGKNRLRSGGAGQQRGARQPQHWPVDLDNVGHINTISRAAYAAQIEEEL